MEFRDHKLPQEAAGQLIQIPISELHSLELFYTPVYVYLSRNQKFVSLKGPIDFFTPQELKKIEPYQSIYVPDSVEHYEIFVKAAATYHELHAVGAGLRPFEIEDLTLQIVGGVWPKDRHLSPLLIAFFIDQICGPLPVNRMITLRDESVEKFEQAVIWSSLGCFLAIHLGYSDIEFLQSLRTGIFKYSHHQEKAFEMGVVQKAIAQMAWSFKHNESVLDLDEFTDGSTARMERDWLGPQLGARAKRIEKSVKSNWGGDLRNVQS